jgi:hypothetical protein
MAEELILTTPAQLKSLLIESVAIALKHHQPPAPAPSAADTAPVMSSGEVKKMTGWPNGTFYQKVSEMPEGVVIRGRSKRLLFNREALVTWLNTPKPVVGHAH